MTVKEDSFVIVALDLREDDRTQFLDFDYFGFEALDLQLLDPSFDMLSCFFQQSVRLPLGIEVSREVWNPDIIHQWG